MEDKNSNINNTEKEAKHYCASQYTSFININVSNYFKLKEISSALLFHMKAYKYISRNRYKYIMAFLSIIHLLLCCSIILESVFVILLLVYWYHSFSHIKYLLSTYYVSKFFRYWRYSGKKKNSCPH